MAPHIIMTPPMTILLIVWFVCERIFTRRSRAGATSRDKGTLLLLQFVQGASIGMGIWMALRFREYAFPAHNIIHICGMFIFVIGFAFRFYAIFYLGRFFTTRVTVAADHRVIDSGPYRFVRHPSYAGLFLIYIGFGLALGNWVSVVVINVPIFAAFLHRMNVEEAALAEALGEPYRNYMKRTKRLIPMVY